MRQIDRPINVGQSFLEAYISRSLMISVFMCLGWKQATSHPRQAWDGDAGTPSPKRKNRGFDTQHRNRGDNFRLNLKLQEFTSYILLILVKVDPYIRRLSNLQVEARKRLRKEIKEMNEAFKQEILDMCTEQQTAEELEDCYFSGMLTQTVFRLAFF